MMGQKASLQTILANIYAHENLPYITMNKKFLFIIKIVFKEKHT